MDLPLLAGRKTLLISAPGVATVAAAGVLLTATGTIGALCFAGRALMTDSASTPPARTPRSGRFQPISAGPSSWPTSAASTRPSWRGCFISRSVQAAMDVTNNPHEGLIFHWAAEVDGKWTVTDVWEAREAYERFREERLFPAIQKVSGMDPTSGPQPTITDFAVHNYVKP